MKVLHRCNWIYSIIVGTLALALIILLPRVSAHAATLPSGNNDTSVTGSGFTVHAQIASPTSSGDGQIFTTINGDAYRGFIFWSGEVYITYAWSLSSAGATLQYHTGNFLLIDDITATYTTTASWTVENAGYTIALVDSSPNTNIGLITGANNAQFYVSYSDLYANANDLFYFTVNVKFSGRSNRSANADYSHPYPPTVRFQHGLTISSTSSDYASGDSLLSQEITDAIEDSLAIQAMEARLGYIHNDLTSMLAQDASNYAGLTSLINSQFTGYVEENNTITPKTTGQLLAILVDIFRNNNAQLTQTNADINQSHNKEQNLQTGFSGILDNLNGGSVDFDAGLVQINAVNPSGFLEQHAQAFEFWRTVGNRALTRNTSTGWGAVAGFLMIVVLLAFTAWVLHL